MCEWQPDFERLNKRVDGIETRITQVEHDVGKMRSETQEGFRTLNSSIDTLAHDFVQCMNTLAAKIVAEKERWGSTLRSVVQLVARTLCYLALAAGGITIAKGIIDHWTH